MAPDVKHHPGGSLSVIANAHGRVVCSHCNRTTAPDDMGMLLRMPTAATWIAVCSACTRAWSRVMLAGMDLVELSGIDL